MSAAALDEGSGSVVLDFNALIARIWAGRWWVVACVASLAGLAVIAAVLMTPIYRATTVLIPAGAQQANLSALGSSLGSLGGLAMLAGIDLDSTDAATSEALAVLRSREFVDAFIRDHELSRQFFSRKWDQHTGKWRVPVDKQPTAADAFKYFDRKILSIAEDRKTRLIILKIQWRDREAAANWANELVARLNAEMRRRAIEQAEAALAFLRKELDATTAVDTRHAINRLIENQINQRMVANVTAEFAFRVVDRALPADQDDVVRPQTLLMILVGAFLGFLLGVVIVVLFRRDR